MTSAHRLPACCRDHHVCALWLVRRIMSLGRIGKVDLSSLNLLQLEDGKWALDWTSGCYRWELQALGQWGCRHIDGDLAVLRANVADIPILDNFSDTLAIFIELTRKHEIQKPDIETNRT